MFVLSNSMLTKILFVNRVCMELNICWSFQFIIFISFSDLGALVIFRVLQKMSIVIGTEIYYIDTDEIPGLFQ